MPRRGSVGLKVRIFSVAAGLAASFAAPVSGARADGISWLMSSGTNAAPVLEGWTADVHAEPARPVAVRDPAWTAKVASLTSSSIATGSIARSAPHEPLAGPRLTGKGHDLNGVASYYWQEQTTATGERFDKRAMTAAHKTLPFGTRVRVTRVDTGNSVVVRINDRGPYKPGRVIDLSEHAAENLGMTSAGTVPVRLEVLGE